MTTYVPHARLSRRLAIGALAALLAGCVNPNAIGLQDTGTVYGRVADATTQQPIANAIVTINSLLNQKTNANGVFSIANVPIGTQTVTVYQNGYQTATVQVQVVKGQQSDAGLISLQPAT
jgi:hypothetical protein